MAEVGNAESRYPFFVEANLIEQVVPDERDRRYAVPLSAYLTAQGLGIVSGGGSLLGVATRSGERDIEYVSLDIELLNLDEALVLTKHKLIELGAPVGSEVNYTALDGIRRSEPIGNLELLNVFIDNADVDPDLYTGADLDALCDEMSRILKDGNIGELRSPCYWPSKVLLYIAGASADDIFARIEPLRTSFPFLQNARVVFQRRNKGKFPKEIRLPFNDT